METDCAENGNRVGVYRQAVSLHVASRPGQRVGNYPMIDSCSWGLGFEGL